MYEFLRQNEHGVVLDLHVVPGARREGVVGIYGQRLKVAVSCPPVDGKANQRLCQILAAIFEIKSSQIEIISGQGSRQKSLALRNISLQKILLILDEQLNSG